MFGTSRRHLLAEVQQLRAQLNEMTGLFAVEIQHLREQIEPAIEETTALRLQRFLKAMHQVVHLQIKAGLPAAEAIAEGVRSVTRPLPYGVPGGRARALYAWRYDDGTFMSYADKEQILADAHERMARGGRARALSARRDAHGRYVS